MLTPILNRVNSGVISFSMNVTKHTHTEKKLTLCERIYTCNQLILIVLPLSPLTHSYSERKKEREREENQLNELHCMHLHFIEIPTLSIINKSHNRIVIGQREI